MDSRKDSFWSPIMAGERINAGKPWPPKGGFFPGSSLFRVKKILGSSFLGIRNAALWSHVEKLSCSLGRKFFCLWSNDISPWRPGALSKDFLFANVDFMRCMVPKSPGPVGPQVDFGTKTSEFWSFRASGGMVYTKDLKSFGRKALRVQFPPCPPVSFH